MKKLFAVFIVLWIAVVVSAQYTSVPSITTTKIFPPVDSTTAIRVMKADGTTAFVTFDSTNKRLGINTTPTAPLDVVGNAYVHAGTLSVDKLGGYTGASIQLGSDSSGMTFTTVSNGSVTLTPNGTGKVKLSTLAAPSGHTYFLCIDSTGAITAQATSCPG